jgi:PEP-CTERM motif
LPQGQTVDEGMIMFLFKKLSLALALMAATLAAPAMAATTISTGPIGTIAPGSTVVCNGVTNCNGALTGIFTNFTTSQSGQWAALPGNSTSQVAVLAGNTAVLTLNQLITSLSLDWGSIDSYNFIDVFFAGGGMQTFGGSLIPPANGNQNLPATNQRVTFNFGGAVNVSSVAFRSTQNSFEFDNVAVAAVPEPGAWMLMLMGFAAVGFSLRRKSTERRVSFA